MSTAEAFILGFACCLLVYAFVATFADAGYAGDKLKGALEGLGNWTIEIVKRSDAAKGFITAPLGGGAHHCLAQPQSPPG